MQYSQHPLSSAFPSMTADEFCDLRDSISVIGVQEPIVMYEGMILDGWHRYTAANELLLDCPFVNLADDVDPRDFVLAKNKCRRNITSAQLAMAVTNVYGWRQIGRDGSKCAPGAQLEKSSAQMAKEVGVSTRTIVQAKKVSRKATEEVKTAVKQGRIGLKKASVIADLPPSEQASAIDKPIEHDDAPSDEEIRAAEQQQQLDIETAQKLLDSDEPMAMLVAENKALKAEIEQLKISRNGYMNQNAELSKRIKQLQRKIDRYEREPQ